MNQIQEISLVDLIREALLGSHEVSQTEISMVLSTYQPNIHGEKYEVPREVRRLIKLEYELRGIYDDICEELADHFQAGTVNTELAMKFKEASCRVNTVVYYWQSLLWEAMSSLPTPPKGDKSDIVFFENWEFSPIDGVEEDSEELEHHIDVVAEAEAAKNSVSGKDPTVYDEFLMPDVQKEIDDQYCIYYWPPIPSVH